MTVREQKARKKRLYNLGWREDANYTWRCKKCGMAMNLVDCHQCGRCESCYKCFYRCKT